MSNDRLESAIRILEKLVGFRSISDTPNLQLIDYVQSLLSEWDVDAFLSYDETGTKANLHAMVGPKVDGGVVFNGHTDVVPVEGQDWSSDAFVLHRSGDRLYGRGSVDMKGFLACMLASVPVWQRQALRKPIHLSMCYDEEIGGFGAPILVSDIEARVPRPEIAIVGEPTRMGIVTGHKGGYELQTTFKGLAAHSSIPAAGVNAINFAMKFIRHLEMTSELLEQQADSESAYHPPNCTINVGTIHGGAARNIVADHCVIDWELRPCPGEDADKILDEILEYAKTHLLPEMQDTFKDAAIDTQLFARVPALDDREAGKAAALISEITGINSRQVVSFATDAGHFCNAGISTVVFGPGDIDRAHKADEFIETNEMAECLKFLEQVGEKLSV